jgi:hypothetical protein
MSFSGYLWKLTKQSFTRGKKIAGVVQFLCLTTIGGICFFVPEFREVGQYVGLIVLLTFVVMFFSGLLCAAYLSQKESDDARVRHVALLQARLDAMPNVDKKMKEEIDKQLAPLTKTEIEVIQLLAWHGPLKYDQIELHLLTLQMRWQKADMPNIVDRKCLLVAYDRDEFYSIKNHFVDVLRQVLLFTPLTPSNAH